MVRDGRNDLTGLQQSVEKSYCSHKIRDLRSKRSSFIPEQDRFYEIEVRFTKKGTLIKDLYPLCMVNTLCKFY